LAPLFGDFIELGRLFGSQDRLDFLFHALEFSMCLGPHPIHQGMHPLVGFSNNRFDLVSLDGIQTKIFFHSFAERFQMPFPALSRAIARRTLTK
jgi:hypothetical protein